MHAKHNIFKISLTTLICCCLMINVDAYCSLEKMKKYAMEACEHLFLQDEAREKRSLSYHDNLIDSSEYATNYNDKFYTTVSRSSFPRGGYLKMGREHYHKLSQIDITPKYKARKVHHEKERFKREHTVNYNNIPYCCYNRCEEDFFC